MFIILYLLLFIIFLIICFFTLPQLSPIPYFPTNKKDLPLIINALRLKNNQLIFDLGAGDGVVIFEAAKEALKRKLNTQFVAVEINPVLLCILYIRRLFHPNRKNIHVINNDMFTMNFKRMLHVTSYMFYLYISPWYLEKVIKNLIRQFAGKNFSVVSYMYPINSLKSKEKIIHGKNSIFVYNCSLKPTFP